ncbi:hypothetical protein D3C80_1116030 [compost metagenome]
MLLEISSCYLDEFVLFAGSPRSMTLAACFPLFSFASELMVLVERTFTFVIVFGSADLISVTFAVPDAAVPVFTIETVLGSLT